MKVCLNCSQPLDLQGKYCAQCGQKIKINKLNFFSILRDFTSNLFNLENKIWRSLVDIWIPAKLSLAYLEGKRVPYYHPIRIFIVVLFAFFTLLLIQLKDGLASINDFSQYHEGQILKQDFISDYDELAEAHPLLSDTILNLKGKIFTRPKKKAASDSLESIGEDGYTVSFTEDGFEVEGDEPEFDDFTLFDNNLRASEFFRLTPAELKQKHGNGKWYKDFFLVQVQKIIKDLQSSISFLIGNGTWAIILLVLSMAMVHKLLYFRRAYKYAEHFIFHLYGHTRVLLVGIVIIVLTNYTFLSNVRGLLIMLFYLAGFIYYYKGVRKFYSQGRRKSFLKTLIGLFSYSLLVGLCILIIAFFSAILL